MASTKQMQERAKARKAALKPAKFPSVTSLREPSGTLAIEKARLYAEGCLQIPGHREGDVQFHDISPAVLHAEKWANITCPKVLPEGFVRLKAGTGRPMHCFQNVSLRVIRDPSCSGQAGVIIWQRPDGTFQGEAHVVLKHPDGTLEDVTSYADGGTHIAFYPV